MNASQCKRLDSAIVAALNEHFVQHNGVDITALPDDIYAGIESTVQEIIDDCIADIVPDDLPCD